MEHYKDFGNDQSDHTIPQFHIICHVTITIDHNNNGLHQFSINKAASQAGGFTSSLSTEQDINCQFVSGNDDFMSLLTLAGKSSLLHKLPPLVLDLLHLPPLVLDLLHGVPSQSVIIVVSPRALKSLMDD